MTKPSGERAATAVSAEFAVSYLYPPGAYPPSPQPYSGFRPLPSVGRNGLGIVSLVIAVVAVVTSVSVVGGIVLGGVAVVIGGVARARAKRGEGTNGQVAIGGVALGAAALVVSRATVVALVAAFGIGLLGACELSSDCQQCRHRHPGDEQFCKPYC